MKKCIAAGSVLLKKDKEGKLVKEIAATVYEDVVSKEKSASNGSGATEGKKSVVLKYKNFAYAKDILAPLGYKEIAAEATSTVPGLNGHEDILAPLGYKEIAAEATLTVPGLNGHEDVKLAAPMSVRYSRTKSFERAGNTVVYATIRYDM